MCIVQEVVFEIPKTMVNTIDEKKSSEMLNGIQSIGKDNGENIVANEELVSSQGGNSKNFKVGIFFLLKVPE